jgi:cyclic-di-GMP-binding protein
VLKWLGGSDKVDHPFADPARAKEIINGFPADDAVKAAQDAVHWLASLNETEGFKLARRYELIDLIDVPLKRHTQKLLEQYLALKLQSKFQEGQIWKAATDYWKALGEAYLTCLAQAEADKSAAAAFRKSLPPLVARAMRAQLLQIKWILMRYGYVNDSYWQTASRLYRVAQSGGFLDEVVDIYGGTHGRGTVRQEFLRVLMLGVSSTGGLSPVKQNIAERAIAHFSTVFIWGERPAEGLNFLFDLNGGVSPARALGEPVQGGHGFYFGAGAALDGTQKIIDAINDTGALPSDINLGPGENLDQMADTLLHLAFNWEKELPPRDSERRRVSATLHVTQGLDGILAQDAGAGSSETWTVENASAGGFGAVVPERGSAWLQVGVLIGLRHEGAKVWGAGIVRRVETDARGQRRVGIQLLTSAVTSATMCTLSAAGARGNPKNVILLDHEPSASGYMLAVLRPESFSLRDAIEARRATDGKTFVMAPSGLVESGLDFDRVRFRVAQ